MTVLNKSKILIIGFGTHGKDTVANLMESYGYKGMSRSEFATSRVMMPYFESVGLLYSSEKECFEDRINHRSTWYDQIEEYNREDWSRLSREILKDGYNVHIGMRSKTELDASRYLYDHIIWVDASQRLPIEDVSSCTVTSADATYILDNNGSLEDLERNVALFMAQKPYLHKVSQCSFRINPKYSGLPNLP